MTREEAIERIKARFDKWALDDEDTKAIQTLIPELRESESEDERIRKALINLVCTVGEYYLPKLEARNKMLDYLEKHKEQKPVDYDHEMWKNCEVNFEGGKKEVIEHPEKYGLQKPAEWSEEDKRAIDRACVALRAYANGDLPEFLPSELIDYADRLQSLRPQPKQEWSEEDEEKIVTISEIIEHCTTIPYSGGTLTLNKEYKKELLCFIKSLRPQYHGDVTMTEAYKMGLEAGKASSWKPSEKQTNNVIVELTRVELGDIINGLYYLKEKYYEDCKEHNGTATIGLSDEFKFYFKRFNEVLDLYTRLHELEKEKYGTTTDGYYYE